jgi:U-box domain
MVFITTMEAFLCPCTGALMEDPVLATDGLFYDHTSIYGRRTSPLTGMPIKDVLVRVPLFNDLMDRWCRAHGVAPPRPPEHYGVVGATGRPVLSDVVERRPARHVLARLPALPPLDEVLRLTDSYAFVCPILTDVSTDPVVALDGHLYDRASLQQWFKTRHTSPTTRAVMGDTVIRSLFFQRLFTEAGYPVQTELGEVRKRLTITESIERALTPVEPPVRLYLGTVDTPPSSDSWEDSPPGEPWAFDPDDYGSFSDDEDF